MLKILYLLTLSSTLLTLTTSNGSIFNSSSTLPISPKLFDIEYSPSQKYIALADTDTKLELRDGITYASYHTIQYGTLALFSTLAFSQDQTKIAVGFQDGDVKVFETKSGRELGGAVRGLGETGAVKGVCWTADNRRFISMFADGSITITLSDNTTTTYTLNTTVEIGALACNPYQSLQFVVAFSNSQQTKLNLMNIDAVTNKITEKEYQLDDPTDPIYSISYSGSGESFSYCSDQGAWKVVIKGSVVTQIVIDPTLKNFRKIRITNKGDVTAISTSTKKLHIQKQTSPSSSTSLPTQTLSQTQTTYLPNFGLSSTGASLFYLTTATQGSISNQCKAGTFLNDKNICVGCQSNKCKQCFGFANYCWDCNDRFYLSANVCLDCVDGCRVCADGLVCQDCLGGFFLEGGLCGACPDGCVECQSATKCSTCKTDYSLKQGLCKKYSFPTWAIVLLVLLGIAIVILIVGFVLIKIRKQRRSPLLSASDERAQVD